MKNKLTSFDLKIIALIFMVVDHINTAFGHQLGLPSWVGFLGRFVAPVFLYLLMEGFKYTKDRKKYLTRLFIGAMVMYGINIVHNILTKAYIHPYTKEFEAFRIISGNNIFWTLFLFLSLFLMMDKIKEESKGGKWKWGILFILLLPFVLLSEGGVYLFPIALACYFFKNDKKKVSLAILVWSTVLLGKAIFGYYTSSRGLISLCEHLAYANEFVIFTSIPFICLYNGQRGGKGKAWEKNLFYMFYPLHFVIIYFIMWFANI
ncbi:conjugal transfer protein TraX [Peptoniphilus sp. KCTC 25270]|uniref:TraX family protein n=1 Tax=Peptoniphilus sp. KCTC 25270 TaxID=2897414 RepID=UPI001E612AD6|nr:TraX family protein [Peptoniphilus sp. KCTC 25270]MCD1146551.1 conjugal transfer protein TraX [Peptoniphilus sp. KCTC 25270]